MKASISMKRASKAAKLRKKMKEEIVVVYTAQRAGRDDTPKHDATSKPDTLDGVINAGLPLNHK